MTDTIFLGGLPRSGSTLLVNMLNQHPEVTCGGTSGLSSLIANARETYSKREEFAANPKSEVEYRMMNLLRCMITGWSIGDTKYYVDKSRGWLPMMGLLKELVGTPLVIVPIRDLRGIFASMEKLYRKNVLNVDPVLLATETSGITIDSRFDTWASTLPVGPAIGHLKDLVDKGYANQVLFVKMEQLTTNPQIMINEVCKAFQMEPYELKLPLENVSNENDRIYGIPGLHETVEDKILPCSEDYETILGPDICKRILNGYSWFYKAFYPELL